MGFEPEVDTVQGARDRAGREYRAKAKAKREEKEKFLKNGNLCRLERPKFSEKEMILL